MAAWDLECHTSNRQEQMRFRSVPFPTQVLPFRIETSCWVVEDGLAISTLALSALRGRVPRDGRSIPKASQRLVARRTEGEMEES